MPNKKTQEPMFEPIVAAKRNFEIIEASIRREIYNGALIPGQKLPNEFELARQFNVGRSAVREALKVLELAGLLVVRRGYNGGTFVAPPDFEEASEAITLTFQPGHMALGQLLEACQTIEPRAAELAASRASEHRNRRVGRAGAAHREMCSSTSALPRRHCGFSPVSSRDGP